jgi:hypothetical protein
MLRRGKSARQVGARAGALGTIRVLAGLASGSGGGTPLELAGEDARARRPTPLGKKPAKKELRPGGFAVI